MMIRNIQRPFWALSPLMFALVLAGCSQSEPARIHDISAMPSTVGSNMATKGVEDQVIYEVPTAELVNSAQSQVVHSNSVSTVTNTNNIVTTESNTITYNRNYDNIPKGGYKGDKYTVQKGDTLYYIAYITGNDTRALAAKNNLREPYSLQIGQVLDVGGSTTVETRTVTTTNKAGTQKSESTERKVVTTPSTTKPASTTTTKPAVSQSQNNQVTWIWPAKGQVKKVANGIDISGNLGDKVVAAADGRVVYVGNDVAGYGNLIIIKHNDDFLTAYGHNQAFLVKEQQGVKAGEQIATMGNTGTDAVKLHFEIRNKTESVDPTKYITVAQ